MGLDTNLTDFIVDLKRNDQRFALRVWRNQDYAKSPLLDVSYGSVILSEEGYSGKS